MKNPDETHSEKSGYSIEKNYRKQATPIQKKLDKLRKDYEALLADTEKTMNKAQKAHNKKLKAHNERFDELLNSNEASFIMDKETLDEDIAKLKAHHQTKLKAINYKNTDKKKAIKAEIQNMEREKQATAKAIEKTHKKRIHTYEKRLDLSKNNHNDNTLQTQNSLKDAIHKLESDYETHKETIDSLDDTLNTRFETLHVNLRDAQEALNSSIKGSDNALQHTLNTYRKEVNAHIRTFSKALTQYRSDLYHPFQNIDASANDLLTQFTRYKETFISNVNQDMKFEQARIKDMLAKTSEEESPDEIKTLNKQLTLQQLRKEALINHIQIFDDAVKMTTDTLKTLSSDTSKFLDGIFKNFDATIQTLQSNLKAKFDIFQSSSSTLRETLTSKFSKDALNPFMSEAKKALKDTLALFSQYAMDKINAIKETTVSLMPLYQEIDDIRFFLDTEDAQKKIKENRERISVEQQDASLNIDMSEAQKKHKVALMNLEESFNTKETTLNHMLDLKGIEEKKAMLNLNETSKSDHIKVEKEIEKAALEHDLESVNADIEIAHVDHAKLLEIAIEKQKNILRSLDLQKERALALVTLETEKNRQLKTLNLKLDHNHQVLQREHKSIDEEKKTLKKSFEMSLKKTTISFEKKEQALQDGLNDVENTHQEKLNFIDQALRRETNKATTRIEQAESLLKTRKDIIESYYDKEMNWLDTHQWKLKEEDPSLKDILIILSTPKKNTLRQTLDTFVATLEETHTLIIEQFSESLKRQGIGKRHHKSQLNKLKNTFYKTLGSLTQQKDDTYKTFEKTVNDTLDTLKDKKKFSKTWLKNQLIPINTHIQKQLTLIHDKVVHSMNEGFQVLKHDDVYLIEKAKTSAKKAKAKENGRYEEAKAPLQKQQDDLTQSKKIKHDALKETLESELSTIDAQHQASLQPLEDAYNKDVENYNALKNKTNEQMNTLENTYQEKIDALDGELEDRLVSIEQKNEERIASVNSRLKDAENIHAFHTENEESKKAELEETLQKDIADLQSYHEVFKGDSERKMKAANDTFLKQKADLEDTLKKTIESYETKMLSSSSELDQRIDKVGRELTDQTRIKRARKETLENSIEESLTKLDSTLERLTHSLQDNTETLLNTLFENDTFTVDTNSLFDKEDAILSDFLNTVKEDIQNL